MRFVNDDDAAPGGDAPGDAPAGSAAITAVIGVAIGLVIAAGVMWFTTRDNAAPPASTGGIESGAGSTEPTSTTVAAFNPVDLVVAYGRSRTEDHALEGEIVRPGQEPLRVRRALMGDRALDEVGSSAGVTEAGETRQCELLDGQWLCTPPLPAVESEVDVQGFATLLLTEAPPYSIFAVSSTPPPELSSITEFGPVTCWSMVSEGRRDRSRFGAETTLCFHDELGALIGRITETSAGDDRFITTELSADVDISDVEPSR